MHRQRHLANTIDLIAYVQSAYQQGALDGLMGEAVWGATVHAISALDLRHTDNPAAGRHQHPNSARLYRAAGETIASRYGHLNFNIGLTVCQLRLHANFYELHLSRYDFEQHMDAGIAFVMSLISAAQGQSA